MTSGISFSGFYLLCYGNEANGVPVLGKLYGDWCGGCYETSAYNLKFHLSLNIMFCLFVIHFVPISGFANIICNSAFLLG